MLLKYLKKMLAKENRGKYYNEQFHLEQLFTSILIVIFCSIFLLTEVGRQVLAVISYLVPCVLEIVAFVFFVKSVEKVLKDYIAYKKKVIAEQNLKKHIYFLDATAFEYFLSKVTDYNMDIKSFFDIDGEVMTTDIVLGQFKQKNWRSSDNRSSSHVGFVNLINSSFDVYTVDVDAKDALVFAEEGLRPADTEDKYLIFSLLKYADEKDTDVIVVSKSQELIRLAQLNEFECASVEKFFRD